MSEHPILFSGPMVRAILDGRKTQTRRVLTPAPPLECSIHYMLGNESWLADADRSPLRHHWEAWGGPLFDARPSRALAGTHEVRCPFGAPGDSLWVRETFATETSRDTGYYAPPFAEAHPLKWTDDPDWGRFWEQPHYKATDPEPELSYDDRDGPSCKWKPSIHMPRWASRLTLTVTGVRVQRLQDVSEDDAKAEGVPFDGTYWRGGIHPIKGSPQCWPTARKAFSKLWDSLNAKRGYGWDVNPWVWAITFAALGLTPPTPTGDAE